MSNTLNITSWQLSELASFDIQTLMVFQRVAITLGEDPDFGNDGTIGAWERLLYQAPEEKKKEAEKAFYFAHKHVTQENIKHISSTVTTLKKVLEDVFTLYGQKGSEWDCDHEFQKLMLEIVPTVLTNSV